MLRDSGWIQLYCEDNQEVLDTTLLAYRLAEDRRVLLPAMVCQDAFVLSHTMMPTEVPDQATVDAFLPPLELPHRMTERPLTVGGLDFPHETEEHRRQQQEAMLRVPEVYEECRVAFAARFGRMPADRVVADRVEDADTVIVSMGTTAATVRQVVDAARARGERVGALRVRMFRPFPEDRLRALLAGRKRVAVIDRDLCPGLGGVLWSELRGAAPCDAIVQGYMVGLGGGDIRPQHVENVLRDVNARGEAGPPALMEIA
jgi:pyruvate/2-oxoacid:ferredoxin oxidoreductase alpha subunit